MTVFKTFLKILNKNKFIVILYTAILLTFAGTNMSTNKQTTDYVASKPDILIINNDEQEGITKDLIAYLNDKCTIKEVDNNEDAISDALFYRDINYLIKIPKGYNKDFLAGKNPTIEVQSTGDYMSSLAEMTLSKYLNVANIYQKNISNEEELLKNINDTLAKESKITITSKLDSTTLERAAYYFNFESYSILACLIYVICLILSIFNDSKIKKRIIISSVDYKKNNRELLLSNCLYSIILWLFYLIVGVILIGNTMFTVHGLIFILNSLAFTLCATTLAFFLGTLITNKNAINGLVNVIALGSSFLCGAFVPQEWLPDFVLKIAHILPTYYYINTNDKTKTLEVIDMSTLKPIIINTSAIIAFMIIFIILTNIVSKKKRKIA